MPIGLALLAGTGVTGCGSDDTSTTLEVAVTSSLTEVLTALSRRYEESHRGVDLQLTFAGSHQLAADLDRRSPVDVILVADTMTLDAVAKLLAGRRVVVAHNSMTIAVGPGNPKRIRRLADLASPRVRLALGAPTVPAGRYARQIFAKSGVTVRPMLAEVDARSVLSRVRTGQADAGIVYITDLKSAGAAASSVPIPAEQNVTATYQAAVVKKSEQQDVARSFVTWLTTPEARSVARSQGFTTP